MKITEKEARYIADLSNLELGDEEVAKYRADLEEILTYVEKLNELDTSNVEPMAQVLYEGSETATFRVDETRPSLQQEEALGCAPESGAGHFKVPKVIER